MKHIELILSRHGETEENLKHILQGQLPGHLSKTGEQQAEQLADRMKNEKLDVIICSDLARSYDTALTVAQHKGLKPVISRLLREMDWGAFTGVVASEADFTKLPESVESAEALYQRAKNFIRFLKEEFPGKRILAIGHGAFNRAIIAYIENKSSEDIQTLPIMKNTECITFII